MKITLRLGMVLLALATSSYAAPPKAQSSRQEVQVPGLVLKTYETPYYYFHTDLDEDDAREAIIRMTKMFEAYRSRTAELFKGQINQRLSFYLFSKGEDYYAAGGMPGSAGVFDGRKLMAMAIRDRRGKIGHDTWHVVQHEGFHQFVAYVIQGQIPTWVNEGLAEYFGEALFTGDGMVTGIVNDGRLQRVQEEMNEGKFKSVKTMMFLSLDEWNKTLDITNYDQAWSMVHFLATAENGKYRDAFAQFLQLIGRGQPWNKAWLATFGSVEGFEDKWKAYWLAMPEYSTLDLYAQADVAAMTSFIGRAYTQKQSFDDFDEFLRTDAKTLKAAAPDWLPPQLFDEMKGLNLSLQKHSVTFAIERATGTYPPRVICTLADGTKITGTFETGAGSRIGKVLTAVIKAANATANAVPKVIGATATTKPAKK